jgi:hypothetical protein
MVAVTFDHHIFFTAINPGDASQNQILPGHVNSTVASVLIVAKFYSNQ